MEELVTWNGWLEHNKYAMGSISKFTTADRPNKFTFAKCMNFDKLFEKDWDLFVLLFRDTEAVRSAIKQRYKRIIPLYAVVNSDYLIISKLVSQQIYELAPKCTPEDIGDLYLKEMGAVLLVPSIASKVCKLPRTYKGIKYPKVQEVLKDGIRSIAPNNHGWLSTNTRLCLEYVIGSIKCSSPVVVELGSWLGQSALVILKAMKKGNLYCFDHFQNVAATDYNFKEPHPLDQFWLTVPRYETFCANIAPLLKPFSKESLRAFTIKYDVLKSISVMRFNFITPEVVFIDAIKSTSRLLTYLEDLFRFNPSVTVVGDDYVFDSVKVAVAKFTKSRKLSLFTTDDAYVLSSAPLPGIKKYIESEIIKNPVVHAVNCLHKRDHEMCIRMLNKIDINKRLPLFSDNTFYTLVIIQVVTQKSQSASIVKNYILQNIDPAPKKLANSLFVTWQDYVDWNIVF